jgi:hypothetical protein
MANNNNDDNRRGKDNLEDNPFIAFRRFADSQVSSLLNTVFTLPVTLATFNNAHHAREQCLFGKADTSQCQKLQHIEDEVAQIRSEGRELYQKGDVREVMKKGEELMKLDREADELRKRIVEDARRREPEGDSGKTQSQLVEEVGKEKGHHWGWDWSWGFPASFDEEERRRANDDGRRHRGMCHRRQRRIVESHEEGGDEGQHLQERWLAIKKHMNEELPRVEDQERAWPFSLPPPADAPRAGKSAHERLPAILDELGDMIMDEVTRLMLPRSFSYHKDEYSPRALEDNEDLRKAGVPWRDAYEDLVRTERGAALIPSNELGQSGDISHDQWTRRFWDPEYAHPEMNGKLGRRAMVGSQDAERRPTTPTYPKTVPWEGEERSEEPSYEYAHDHEDQHDEPPSPKQSQGKWIEGMPTTEMEAYERLLEPATTAPDPVNTARTTILSTLTTTERTVAPDGTTTTKVVLKKRFADGREESSETVHTQRGQDPETRQDPWKSMREAQFADPPKQPSPLRELEKKKESDKKGWFWSN